MILNKINDTKIIIIGLGSLGCSTLTYLLSNNVKNISIIDYKRISNFDINNQFIYSQCDINQFKVDICKLFFKDKELSIFKMRLTNKNSIDLLKNFDYIVDCTNDITSSCIINDACVLLNKQFFYGCSINTCGQVGIFSNSYCFRCCKKKIYTNNDVSINSVNIVSNLIGNLLGLEIIKFIYNYGGRLTLKILNYDIIQGFYYINCIKDNKCLICSKNAIINSKNYEKLNIYDNVSFGEMIF